jgi:hypothetical protein
VESSIRCVKSVPDLLTQFMGPVPGAGFLGYNAGMVARNFRAVLAMLCAAWALSGTAQAQVFQSDAAKTPLPQPVGKREWDLVTSSWAYNTKTQVNHDPMARRFATRVAA